MVKKDFIYIAVIIGLLTLMYYQYIQHREDSHSRIVNCFKDVVEEVEWCEKFFDKYRE